MGKAELTAFSPLELSAAFPAILWAPSWKPGVCWALPADRLGADWICDIHSRLSSALGLLGSPFDEFAEAGQATL